MKNGENFQLLYDLADKLNAAGSYTLHLRCCTYTTQRYIHLVYCTCSVLIRGITIEQVQ